RTVTAAEMADSGMAWPDTVITVGLSPSGDMGPGSGDWALPPGGTNVPATKKSALHPRPRLRALLTRPVTLSLLVLTFVFRFPFHRLAHPIEHTAHVLAQFAKHRLVLIVVVVAAFIVVLGALAGVCLARLTHAWACGPGRHRLDDDRGERLRAEERIVRRRRAGGSHHDLVNAPEAGGV